MARPCLSLRSIASSSRTLLISKPSPKSSPLSRLQQPTQCLQRQQRCNLSGTTILRAKTAEQVKAQQRTGPFSLYAGLFFLLCGGGVAYYFNSEKERLGRKRVREASKGVGKARIGGDFELIDQNGKPFSSEDLKGKFSLIYYGFSHCPDICPDELDKMAKMIDLVKAKRGNVLRPIFITCDPNRDTPAVLKDYLSDFHPDIIGLTGTWEQVKAVCKAYRVYFSTPPHVKPGQDYLVDHSIYFYLMDPEGDFIEVVGRQHTATQGYKLIADHIDGRMGRKVTPESFKEIKPTSLDKILPKVQNPDEIV